jgi:hypothetical protein
MSITRRIGPLMTYGNRKGDVSRLPPGAAADRDRYTRIPSPLVSRGGHCRTIDPIASRKSDSSPRLGSSRVSSDRRDYPPWPCCLTRVNRSNDIIRCGIPPGRRQSVPDVHQVSCQVAGYLVSYSNSSMGTCGLFLNTSAACDCNVIAAQEFGPYPRCRESLSRRCDP